MATKTPKGKRTSRKKMGRPTKFTKKVKENALKVLALGLSERIAADFIKVDFSTFIRWKKRHPSFATSVTHAKSLAKVRMTTKLMNQAMGGDSRALEFWIKHNIPEIYGNKIEITGKDGADLFGAESLKDIWKELGKDEIGSLIKIARRLKSGGLSDDGTGEGGV